MIRNIVVENFRRYKRLEIGTVKRLNVVAGDNGTGKTSLLEAIFLALGRSPELGVRYRQQRGLDGVVSGQPRRIEDALWRTLFYNADWNRTISVQLEGDGIEGRSVRVFRGKSQLTIPLGSDISEGQELAPLTVVWRDHRGQEWPVTPRITREGIAIDGTGEDNPDFYYYAANAPVPSDSRPSRRPLRHRAFCLG